MDIILSAAFTASKIGKTGLTPTVTCYATERSTGTRTTVVNAQNMTEVGLGLYEYRLASATPETHDYKWCAVTADSSVDQQQVHGWIGPFAGAYATQLAYLDALVSSRLATAGYTAPLSAAGVRTAVGLASANLDTQLAGLAQPGDAMDLTSDAIDDVAAAAAAAGVTVNATVALSATEAETVATGGLALRSFHTFAQSVNSTSAAALNTATKVWLALKERDTDLDAAAVVLIEAAAGLTVLAGAAYGTTAHGTLVVSGSAGAWTITAGLDEVATGLLAAYANKNLLAEVKAKVGSSTVHVWSGKARISSGIVRATS